MRRLFLLVFVPLVLAACGGGSTTTSTYKGPERRQHRPWSLGRRADDRKWPRFARDLWLTIVSGVTLIAVWNTNDLTGRVARNQRATTQARRRLPENASPGVPWRSGCRDPSEH